jgi:hypothetical protein
MMVGKKTLYNGDTSIFTRYPRQPLIIPVM